MDDILLRNIKNYIEDITKVYDELCAEKSLMDYRKRVQLIYEIVKKDINAIYQVNESIFVTENYDYSECSNQLKPLLRNQILLAMLFKDEHNDNIIKTTNRMSLGDAKSYLEELEFKDINYNEYNLDKSFIDIIQKIDDYINDIVEDTKQRYTDSFGNFNNIEEANFIIKREYNNYLKFAKLFLDIKETIYEFYDNYDPIVNGLENLSYELVQLIAVLERGAKSFKTANTTTNLCYEDIYFILMDGVSSTTDKNTEQLITDTINLNKQLLNDKDLKLICKFGTYKQDEIQGFVIGDINKVLKLIDMTYNSNVKVTYSQKPYIRVREYIDNIEETIFNIPFNIYGPICKETRINMNNKRYVILGKNSLKDSNILFDTLVEGELSTNILA